MRRCTAIKEKDGQREAAVRASPDTAEAGLASVRVDVEVENPARPGERRTVSAVLVD